jgi:hypothetical protein
MWNLRSLRPLVAVFKRCNALFKGLEVSPDLGGPKYKTETQAKTVKFF